MSTDLRERIARFLDRFSEHHGHRLGERLWNADLQRVALITAEGIGGDIAIWIADEAALHPIFNGPRAESLVGKHVQPLNAGIISMVYATEQSFCTSDVRSSQDQDRSVDMLIGIETHCLMASPLYFGAGLRGIVSAARFADTIDPAPRQQLPFSKGDMTRFETMVRTIGKLFDQELFTQACELG